MTLLRFTVRVTRNLAMVRTEPVQHRTVQGFKSCEPRLQRLLRTYTTISPVPLNPEEPKRGRIDLGRGSRTMDRHFGGGHKAQFHAVAVDLQYDDLDILANLDGLISVCETRRA